MTPSVPFQTSLARFSRTALLVGAAGVVLGAGAAWVAPEQFYPAYLVAYLFWLGLSLGSLAISMLHYLTGGGWGVSIRRIVESGASTCLLMGLLFLPIVRGMPVLYLWTDSRVLAADEVLRSKAIYLNADSFLIRAAVYFIVWIFWSLVLNGCSATADAERQARRRRFLAVFSGWGLALWGLSVTFAAIDWAMSLEPHWSSSMYGVLFIGGQGVSAMSLAVVVAVWPRHSPRSFNVLTTARLHDLGNFLLAFVMFWSYVSFMQFLIIWSANLPEETPWYLRRSQGGWQLVVGLLMVLHFLTPFFLLLMRQVKRVGRRLAMIAILLLVMRLVDLCWLVLPPFTASLTAEGAELWPLLVTVPAIGGLWLSVFGWRLSVAA